MVLKSESGFTSPFSQTNTIYSFGSEVVCKSEAGFVTGLNPQREF